MDNLRKQVDEILQYIITAPTTAQERSKMILEFAKLLKKEHPNQIEVKCLEAQSTQKVDRKERQIKRLRKYVRLFNR